MWPLLFTGIGGFFIGKYYQTWKTDKQASLMTVELNGLTGEIPDELTTLNSVINFVPQTGAKIVTVTSSDASVLSQLSGSSPASWSFKAIKAGTALITASLVDASNNVATAQVNVTVVNVS